MKIHRGQLPSAAVPGTRQVNTPALFSTPPGSVSLLASATIPSLPIKDGEGKADVHSSGAENLPPQKKSSWFLNGIAALALLGLTSGCALFQPPPPPSEIENRKLQRLINRVITSLEKHFQSDDVDPELREYTFTPTSKCDVTKEQQEKYPRVFEFLFNDVIGRQLQTFKKWYPERYERLLNGDPAEWEDSWPYIKDYSEFTVEDEEETKFNIECNVKK